ncbi:hypothetical protein CH371_12910 [Leptospira wolffii]|uniref:DUF4349 domain-containing protein n=1 Tax=Leptospira wolffii TaxID=409998 RepID=A0A2M9ZA84_9LEPT|nr:DUF4349 domain-containing protein [Leptospira wolffii]PJZ65294.1 hypothetical protein CH371_12910 [Leptospira wolffii]
MPRILILFLILLFSFFCQKDSSPEESRAIGQSAKSAAPTPAMDQLSVAGEDADLKTAPVREKKDAASEEAKLFSNPKVGNLKIGRLLEYKANLSFTVENFISARKFLLELSSKYGFVLNENFYSSDGASPSSMNVTFHVRSSDLYEVLLELDKLGALVSENIEVEDHTESFTLEQIHAKRERIRGARRGELANRASTKTAAEIEALVAESEDAADSAEFEKWKILDRVSWAKITVHVEGPRMPKSVEVPNFKDAWIDLVEIGLKLLLLFIYILPLAILIGLFVYGFRAARSRWRNK